MATGVFGRGSTSRNSTPGFTLVEAMVSFLILVLVLGQLAYVQDAARRLLARTRYHSALARQLQNGYAVFARDCAHFQVPGFLVDGQPVIDVTQVSGEESMAKVSFYVAEYSPVGMQEIRKITYTLEGANLTRRSSPAVDSNQGNLAQERVMVLVEGVSGLQIKLGAGGQTWVSDWTRSGRKGVPQGLLQKLSIAGAADRIWARMFGGAALESFPTD
jgi:type II secretory pathway component PulJ